MEVMIAYLWIVSLVGTVVPVGMYGYSRTDRYKATGAITQQVVTALGYALLSSALISAITLGFKAIVEMQMGM